MSLLHMAGGATEDKLYVEDVFSTYLYTGNGSTQTINNGIDLAGKGGLVWIKSRTQEAGHILTDTLRGPTKYIRSSSTESEYTNAASLTQFNSNGFNLGSMGGINTSGANHVSWTFRKAPKFFDVVTYTGNGVAGRQIPHSLGCEVGMIVVKRLDTAGNWRTWHKGYGNGFGILNTTLAFEADNGAFWGNGTVYTAPTSTHFTIAQQQDINWNGATYVAYLFAHDPSADGIIQCGSFTTDASGNASVTLGWEPQYLMVKSTNNSNGWVVIDSGRGFTNSGDALSGKPTLPLNSSSVESEGSGGGALNPTATGFQFYAAFGGLAANSSNIYLAIRRPMKVPTSGTQVYNAIASSATTSTVMTTGFPIDLQINAQRNPSMADNSTFMDRLRGLSIIGTSSSNKELYSSATSAEVNRTNSTSSFSNTGFSIGSSRSGVPTIYYSLKRAKGFFDIVCYTGTGLPTKVPHSLGVEPELIITKGRSQANGWYTQVRLLGANNFLQLQSTAAVSTSTTIWNNALATSVQFTQNVTVGVTNVAYLFATLAGVSKVGSYTGNGTTQTINCGFSSGARFILIKRTDSTGDWYVWDTVRGIVAGNDPHLSLNTASEEVTTDDSVDPESRGFIVNQVAATDINANGGSYIFLAIA